MGCPRGRGGRAPLQAAEQGPRDFGAHVRFSVIVEYGVCLCVCVRAHGRASLMRSRALLSGEGSPGLLSG